MQQPTSAMISPFGSLVRLIKTHCLRSPHLLQRSSILVAALVLCLSGYTPSAAAKKTEPPDEFPPNPLELKVADPLLPPMGTSLTTQEQQTLRAALDELNAQATTQ